MEKTAAVAALAFVVVLLFCTKQAGAQAQAQCLLPPQTRPYYEKFTAPILNQTKLDEIGLLCEQGPGSAFSGCCKGIEDWVNITCACSPGSGLVLPHSILTSATSLCGVKIPQVGQCLGHCGLNQSMLQVAERACEIGGQLNILGGDHTSVQPNIDSCCRTLRDLEWECLCSPASRLAISPAIYSAIAFCRIPVPQTGQCSRPLINGNCNLVTQKDMQQVYLACSTMGLQSFGLTSTEREDGPQIRECCQRMEAVMNSTCVCTPYLRTHMPSFISTTPQAIARECNVISPPSGDFPICPGTCGVLTQDLHEIMRTLCDPLTQNCCQALKTLDFNCLCSPKAQPQLLIPPALLTAARSCGVLVPGIGQCALGNCTVVTQEQLDRHLLQVCGTAVNSGSRSLIQICCRRVAVMFSSSTCVCTPTSGGLEIPFKLRDIVSLRCRRPRISLPKRLNQCQAAGVTPHLAPAEVLLPSLPPITHLAQAPLSVITDTYDICISEMVDPFREWAKKCELSPLGYGPACCDQLKDFINSTRCECISAWDFDVTRNITAAANVCSLSTLQTALCRQDPRLMPYPILARRRVVPPVVPAVVPPVLAPVVTAVPSVVVPPVLEENCTSVMLDNLQGMVKTCEVFKHPISSGLGVRTACCGQLKDLINSTSCLCAPVSGLDIARNITTAASLCSLSPLQIAQCRQGN